MIGTLIFEPDGNPRWVVHIVATARFDFEFHLVAIVRAVLIDHAALIDLEPVHRRSQVGTEPEDGFDRLGL